jgi:hypothetical protein
MPLLGSDLCMLLRLLWLLGQALLRWTHLQLAV